LEESKEARDPGEECVVTRLTSRPDPRDNLSEDVARELVAEYRRKCKRWDPTTAYYAISKREDRKRDEEFRRKRDEDFRRSVEVV
jgi:hypothetical protein